MSFLRFGGKTHLFECELKLSSVQQQLEQHLGLVLGVTENLVFDLTQPLVVWVIGYDTKTRLRRRDIYFLSYQMQMTAKTELVFVPPFEQRLHF